MRDSLGGTLVSSTAAVAAALVFAAPSQAQEPTAAELAERLDALSRALAEDRAALQAAASRMSATEAQIEAAKRSLAALGAQPAPTSAPSASPVAAVAAAAPRPVGAAPPPAPPPAALPEGVSVLTAPGRIVLDSALSYTQASSNRVIFRGVEIIPGVQVGLLDANDTERNRFAYLQSVRFGLTPRMDVELVVPFHYSNDRVTSTVPRQEAVTVTRNLEGSGLGDIELIGRYQLTTGRNGEPVLVANLRAKPPTGESAYDASYDSNGVIQELPTGSGFFGLESSFSALLRTDPAVLYATLGYLHNFASQIDRTIGDVRIGRVEPGNSINASLGFGLALNERISFSLGFKNSYVTGTTQQINGIERESSAFQIGASMFGLSYRLTEKLTLSQNFEIGATESAPNFVYTLRLPLALN